MTNKGFDMWYYVSDDMRHYLQNHGFHFSRKACDYAVDMMRGKDPSTGEKKKIDKWSKEQVDDLLSRFGVEIENKNGYDHVYVANMAKADFMKRSLSDEMHVALYVKDVIDDIDAAEGSVFRSWMACMSAKGISIDWEEMI